MKKIKYILALFLFIPLLAPSGLKAQEQTAANETKPPTAEEMSDVYYKAKVLDVLEEGAQEIDGETHE